MRPLFILFILIFLFGGIVIFYFVNNNSEMFDSYDGGAEQVTKVNSGGNSKEENPKVHSEVWSQKSPYGESYEFKVNCYGEYEKLETCFLYDVDSVRVITPLAKIYELEKDFNINNYSGEITRRWVLYGPMNATLPISGEYKFEFIKNGEVIFVDKIFYEQSKIFYPTEVRWIRLDDELHVSWNAPEGVDDTMWYKVIVWNLQDTPQLFISDIFEGNVTNAILEDVPLLEGGNYSLNVAVFFKDGYAYSEYIDFEW